MDPYRLMRRFMEDLKELMEGFPKGEVGVFQANFRIPRARVREEGKAYIYEVELPGVEKKDITVEWAERSLTIKAERHLKMGGKGGRREEHLTFRTVLPVFPDGDYERAKATFKDGILTIKVPKVGKGRRIKIQ